MIDDSESVAPKRVRRKNDPRIFTAEEEAELRAMYNYDPETGVFTWKRKPARNRKKAGDKAGCRATDGRWVLNFRGDQISAYRVAFFFMMGRWPLPGMEVDHRDGDPSNDRWSNLREATKSQNQANRCFLRRNTSGFKGVYLEKNTRLKKRWRAQIFHCGKLVRLGCYLTGEEAHEAYCSVVLFLYGDFANFGCLSPNMAQKPQGIA